MKLYPERIEQTNYSLGNPIIKWLLANFINKIGWLLLSINAPQMQGLDAGCGEGHMLGHLHERGVLGKLSAVDVSHEHLLYASNTYPYFDYFAASINYLPFPDKCFDYVLSTEVFEHIETPQLALKEVKRVSKKDAYLIISVPFEPFFHLGNILRGKYLSRGGYTPDHCNLWHSKDFKTFVSPFVHIEQAYAFHTFPWMLYKCRFK
jgi:ubiquinone/menaquinone biosynthesis C-methylase UbiE